MPRREGRIDPERRREADLEDLGDPTQEHERLAGARIVLACADGLDNGRSPPPGVTGRHRRHLAERFLERRLEGLADEHRPGLRAGSPTPTSSGSSPRPWRASPGRPTGAPGAWPRPSACRSPPSSDRAFGLKPHQTETFKLSNGPVFVEKVRDVVGLYMSPPERAIVCASTRRARSRLGPYPAAAADGARAGRAAHARLCPQRDDLAVRGAERRHRLSDRQVPSPTPPPGVPQVPERGRRKCVQGTVLCGDHREANPPRRFSACRTWSKRSWSTWKTITVNPGRSFGQWTPTRFWAGLRQFVNELLSQDTRSGSPTGLLAAFLKTSTPGATKISYNWTADTGKVNVYQVEVLAAE